MGGSIDLARAFGIAIKDLVEDLKLKDFAYSYEEKKELADMFIKLMERKHKIFDLKYEDEIEDGVISVKGTFLYKMYGPYSSCYGISKVLSAEADSRNKSIEELMIQTKNFYNPPTEFRLKEIASKILQATSLRMEWKYMVFEDIHGYKWDKDSVVAN